MIAFQQMGLATVAGAFLKSLMPCASIGSSLTSSLAIASRIHSFGSRAKLLA